MASRNELLRQMQRPPTPEELLNELDHLRRGDPHLSVKQKIRLDELEKWHIEYRRETEERFRHWVFHPDGAEKVAESREEFEKALSDGWYATRDERKAAIENSKTAEGRQEIIEREFKEEVAEEKEFNRDQYLIFLKRSMEKDSGAKMLYYYTVDELLECYKKLGLSYDESIMELGAKARIELYKNLRSYIELNT